MFLAFQNNDLWLCMDEEMQGKRTYFRDFNVWRGSSLLVALEKLMAASQ